MKNAAQSATLYKLSRTNEIITLTPILTGGDTNYNFTLLRSEDCSIIPLLGAIIQYKFAVF
jgi:hypothetical protein